MLFLTTGGLLNAQQYPQKEVTGVEQAFQHIAAEYRKTFQEKAIGILVAV